jgi:WD40 repeat protein
VAVSPDGRTIAAASSGGAIWLLGAEGLTTTARLEASGHGPVNGLMFTEDGRRLVSWGGSRAAASTSPASIVVWDVAARQQVGPAFGQIWPDAGGGLLADGVTLVLAQHGPDPAKLPTAVAWSIDARTPSTAYELPDVDVEAMRVSPDGRYVTLGTPNGSVIVDPAAAGVREIRGARNPLALSPDGRTLLTGDGPTVGLWDTAQGVRRAQAVRHTGAVLDAAWSADAKTFATAGADGLVILWDTATLQPIKTLAGHGSPVRVVRFAIDGRTLYTVGDDGSLLAWDLTGTRGVGGRLAHASPAAVLGLACALAGRDLTPQEWQTYLPSRSYQHVCPV